MIRKPIILAGLAIALLAMPAFAQNSAPANTTDQAPAKAPYSQGSVTPPGAGSPHSANVPVDSNASSGTAVRHATGNAAVHHKQAMDCYNYAYQSAQMNNCLAHNQTAGVTSSGTTGNTGATLMQNGNRGTMPSTSNPGGKGPPGS
jgi:hypothetical protein